jgi:hypothetical protein
MASLPAPPSDTAISTTYGKFDRRIAQKGTAIGARPQPLNTALWPSFRPASHRKDGTTMSRLMLVAAAVLISSAALAQTKDQCGTVASVLAPVISYIVPLEERVTSINWDLVIPNSSGRFRSSAEVVKQAQINFITATRRYRIALEAMAHETLLCAQ